MSVFLLMELNGSATMSHRRSRNMIVMNNESCKKYAPIALTFYEFLTAYDIFINFNRLEALSGEIGRKEEGF